MDDPGSFKFGLFSLWAAIALQAVAASFIKLAYQPETGLLGWLFIAVPAVLLGCLAYFISKRKNWARIIVLVWFLLLILPCSFVRSVPAILSSINGALPDGTWPVIVPSVLVAAATLLEALSLYVFFSRPSSLLFRKAGREVDGVAA